MTAPKVLDGSECLLPRTGPSTGQGRAVQPWLSMKLTIPAPCAWINTNNRIHRMQEAKLTAAWREAGYLAARGLMPETGPVTIWASVWKPIANRYDPQNLYGTGKAVVDGFRDAGILADDDWRHVAGPFMIHGGTGPAQIILEIVPSTTP